MTYSAATVTDSGVKPNNQPTDIQLQEKESTGHITTGCQTRCSNKVDDPKDYNAGRYTDRLASGTGNAFTATQHFYFGTSSKPAPIVMEISPGYYALGTSTKVTASANSVEREIQ